jgi:hypothetical protein
LIFNVIDIISKPSEDNTRWLFFMMAIVMTNDVSFEDSTIHINILKKKGKKPSEACIQQDKHNINNQKN